MREPDYRARIVQLEEELTALRETARSMRREQKRYFRTRDRGTLAEAQRLERWLDAMIDPAPTLPGMGVDRG